MEQSSQSAETYYNQKRKRSFFYSRVTVFVSMIVLVGVLAFNVNSLYNDPTVTQSRASEQPNTNNLPKLPKGCEYKPVNNGFEVVCTTPTPEATPETSGINVQLPKLPPQCSIEALEGGNRVVCTTGVPIPTAAVTLPANCIATAQANTVSCVKNNKNVQTPLPSLPGGCSYKQVGQNYFVVCSQ